MDLQAYLAALALILGVAVAAWAFWFVVVRP